MFENNCYNYYKDINLQLNLVGRIILLLEKQSSLDSSFMQLEKIPKEDIEHLLMIIKFIFILAVPYSTSSLNG